MLSFLKKKPKKSVQPVIEEIASTIKSVGKPIITGTSGGIGGINVEEFYNHE